MSVLPASGNAMARYIGPARETMARQCGAAINAAGNRLRWRNNYSAVPPGRGATAMLLAMKPGTRIVSNSFDLGDWTADETASIDGEVCTSHCTAYFWLVPAKVEGTWQTPQGELTLEQKYQALTGILKKGNVIAPVSGAASRIVNGCWSARWSATTSGARPRHLRS